MQMLIEKEVVFIYIFYLLVIINPMIDKETSVVVHN